MHTQGSRYILSSIWNFMRGRPMMNCLDEGFTTKDKLKLEQTDSKTMVAEWLVCTCKP